MKKGIVITVIVIVIAILAFAALKNNDEGTSLADTQQGASVSLENLNLKKLDEGSYEGWLIFGTDKVSTGKFNSLDELTFSSERNPNEADSFVLTIEPEGDSDEEPSGIVVLSGDFVDGRAELSFPANLVDIKGTYILGTPTDGLDNNETSGIWFVVPGEPLQPSLDLPELPEGWVYEGWVVNKGVGLTTGRFTEVDERDSFDGFSGDQPGPSFPGEDYLVNAPAGLIFPADLADGETTAIVSVEPDLNGVDPTGNDIFSIMPLVAEIPLEAPDHSNFDLQRWQASIPTGTVVIN
jgi:hypothetical protein